MSIARAETASDLDAAAALFAAYAGSLPIDLGYQGFAVELASLPGAYAPPLGALLLARDAAGAATGCVALRPLAPGACELKRLYVAPAGRGHGLGRALLDAALAAAGAAGHRRILLDTLPSMQAALSLYRAAGFRPTPAYYATPIAGTVFLGRAVGGATPP